MRQFGGSAALLLLATFSATLAQGQEGAKVTGTIIQTWSDRDGHSHQRGYSVPLPVRLCSVERVLETQSDKLGEFVFSNVPPGVYELSTGRQVSPPHTMRGIEIKGGEADAAPLLMDLNDTAIMSMETADCFRDTNPPTPTDCGLALFRIDYESRLAREKGALLTGRVTDFDSKRPKGLGNVKVSLTKLGDPSVFYSAVSDKGGFFKFTPPEGAYELSGSLDGFQDFKISDFLVPRENNTTVTIFTRSKKTIVVCQ